MKRQRLVKWGILGALLGLVLLIACGVCGYIYYQSSREPIVDEPRLLDYSPEKVFQGRFMDGVPIPSGVFEIDAIEGGARFGESIGPAYIRFKATSTFIAEMLKKDYGRNGRYSVMPCPNVPSANDLFIKKFPEKFEWWKPDEVTKPVCYTAYTCKLYDEKFLLVDTNNNIVYFYRTPICGLCPSGQEGAELRKSEQCQQ